VTRLDLPIEAREAARARAKREVCTLLAARRDDLVEQVADEVVEQLWQTGWRPVGPLPSERRAPVTTPAGKPAPVPPPEARQLLEQARRRAATLAAQHAQRESAPDEAFRPAP